MTYLEIFQSNIVKYTTNRYVDCNAVSWFWICSKTRHDSCTIPWGVAMELGKHPVPGRPTIWITVRQGPTALAVGAGWGCLDIFTLIYPFSPLSPSLWETARYRLKYCLKGPLNPKQPTNQMHHSVFDTKKISSAV